MRQPKRHFSYGAGTAIYLDATIGPLMPCRSGCKRDAAHLCIHRFGPQVYVLTHQERIAFTRLSDLQVILDFLHVILHRWKNGTCGVWDRRYVILTNDRRFLQSAEWRYYHERNMRELPLRFVVDGALYRLQGYPWEIKVEVHYLPKGFSDNRRAAIEYVRAHLGL